MKKFFVIVSYGNKNNHDLTQKIKKILKNKTWDIININTKFSENEAFEFSGYMSGLIEIKKKINSNENISIIFANDTIFESHLAICSNLKIKAIISKINKTNGKTLMGSFTHLKKNSPLREITEENFYISTYLFAITCDAENIERLQFYDNTINDDLFKTFYNDLSLNYKIEIDKWLMPSSLFKGWYKASPFDKIDNTTLWRKRLTIYLEHTLVKNIRKLDFQILDINKDNYFLRVTDILDIAYSNILKFAYRTRCFIKK